MNKTEKKPLKQIMRLCQKCGHLNESEKELERCIKCSKWFLPMNYATAQATVTSGQYKLLFKESEEIAQEDTIKGITVIW